MNTVFANPILSRHDAVNRGLGHFIFYSKNPVRGSERRVFLSNGANINPRKFTGGSALAKCGLVSPLLNHVVSVIFSRAYKHVLWVAARGIVAAMKDAKRPDVASIPQLKRYPVGEDGFVLNGKSSVPESITASSPIPAPILRWRINLFPKSFRKFSPVFVPKNLGYGPVMGCSSIFAFADSRLSGFNFFLSKCHSLMMHNTFVGVK